MVHVSKDGTVHRHKCGVVFTTYSVSSMVHEQAAASGWVRERTGRILWPGEPPMADAKKVDLCPEHAKLVIPPDEIEAYREKRKAEKKAERDKARAEAKRQKEAEKELAKSKKRKAKEQSGV
jgi:hypothetical protein